MPSKHENLDPYRLVGYPVAQLNTVAEGSLYVYRAPASVIADNIPAVSETWADSRPVATVDIIPLSPTTRATPYTELRVGTSIVYGGEVIGTSLEQSFYQLRWRPIALPLEVHPGFRGGSLSLATVYGTGADSHTGYQDIIGWRAELDPRLRANFQYNRLDSNGNPGSTVTLTGGALAFAKLAMRGVEEYVDYMPVWTKRSIYRGSSAPGTTAIGTKGTPAGSGYPGGYEWVKSADNVERIGASSRWRRDEEWEGCVAVFVDKDEIYEP